MQYYFPMDDSSEYCVKYYPDPTWQQGVMPEQGSYVNAYVFTVTFTLEIKPSVKTQAWHYNDI